MCHSAVHVFNLVFSDPQHKPPLEINDLFEDIKDGVKLLALLEVLSGQRLVSRNMELNHKLTEYTHLTLFYLPSAQICDDLQP